MTETYKQFEDCITRAIELVLSSPEDLNGRHGQIKAMVERDRKHAGELCVYLMQSRDLNAKPWESLPMNADGERNDPAGRLVRRLRKAGLSQWEPEPLKALARAGKGNGLA